MLLPSGGFRHYFHEHMKNAVARYTALNAAGNTVYIAQATYDAAKIRAAQSHNKSLPKGTPRSERKKERSQDNAKLIKNFFLDIDCGEKWPLKNQREAVHALNKFIKDTQLPFPAVVNSGNGLYAHWALAEAIPAPQWRTIAFLLKQVVATYSPAIGGDSSRTSDSASVLRPVGTMNRKPGREEKEVTLWKDMDPIPFMDFVRALDAAAKRKKIKRDAVLAPKPSKDVNADFYAGLELQSIPSIASKVADKCGQLGEMRSSKGDISEPLWYACLGVLGYCQDGDTVAQEWSSGHPQYTHGATAEKMQQWMSADIGPSTCANLGSINPQGCIGCPSKGKIKSPIVLGRPDPKPLELPEEQCSAPDGYKRGKDGLYALEDDRWVKFYDQDLYVERMSYDESLGYVTTTIKHSLPFEGEMEFTIRASTIHDPKSLMVALSDNYVSVVGVKEKKYMVGYIESYQHKLQRKRRMALLLCQMGWKTARNGKPIFVHGKKIYNSDGTVEDASLAKNVPPAVEGFRQKGSLEKWSEAWKVLNKPGMEPYAFALLAGGFGAPLMKFTGFDGAMVSLVGNSGAGKTLMLSGIHSVWGHHKDLMMLQGDTHNAVISRLGVYGCLPLTVDEVTNMPGLDVSRMAYGFTHGRDKARLTKTAEERKVLNRWTTLAVTSSNSSLVGKLADAKHDARAEINRIFEYTVNRHPQFQGKVTENLYWAINENYGHAGEVYAKYLVQRHPDELKLALSTLREQIDAKSEIKGEERYWSATVAVAIYGGLIAKHLGLLDLDMSRVFRWAVTTLRSMRVDKNDLTGTSADILAQFIDSYTGHMLIVKDTIKNSRSCIIVQLPRVALNLRLELDTGRLYISRNFLREYLSKHYGDYASMKNDLVAARVLLNPNKRKVLGTGTHLSGAQQPCWEVNMNSDVLGPQVSSFLEAARAIEAEEME